MGLISTMLVTLITGAVVAAILASARRRGQTGGGESFTVRFSAGVLAVGIVCTLVFGALGVMAGYALQVQGTLPGEDIPFVFGVLSFFLLLGAFLTVAAVRFQLRAVHGRIEYTPVFGRARLIGPEEIAYVTMGTTLKAYDSDHRKLFSVDAACKGRDALVDWLLRYGVRFGREASFAQVAAHRLRTLGRRRPRTYAPKTPRQTAKSMRERQRAAQERYRRYKEDPADLPDNLEELLRPLLRQSVGLHPGSSTAPCAVGCSKFGGQPDVPPGFEWDYYEGTGYDNVLANRPLAFLLQVNCREAAAACPGTPLPKQGLLSFFYELESMPWGPEPLETAGYVKLHYFADTEALVRTPLPADLKEEYHLPQHPISLKKEGSLPAFWQFLQHHPYSNNQANLTLYEQHRERLGGFRNARNELAMNSRMLGWPESIQNDVFDDFMCEYLKEHTGPAAAEEDWELLLQLDSGTFDDMGAGSVMFGDYGNVYLGIRKEDLENGELGKAWFTLQCT